MLVEGRGRGVIEEVRGSTILRAVMRAVGLRRPRKAVIRFDSDVAHTSEVKSQQL